MSHFDKKNKFTHNDYPSDLARAKSKSQLPSLFLKPCNKLLVGPNSCNLKTI
jgi:hypothetical protein